MIRKQIDNPIVKQMGYDNVNHALEVLFKENDKIIMRHSLDVENDPWETVIPNGAKNILNEPLWKDYCKNITFNDGGILFSNFPIESYADIVATESNFIMEVYPLFMYHYPKTEILYSGKEIPADVWNHWTFGRMLARIIAIGPDIYKRDRHNYVIGQWCILKDEPRDWFLFNRYQLFVVREPLIAAIMPETKHYFIY